MKAARRGVVYFIGAGPGDPELITVKGLRILKEADLVLYAGSLVNPDILEFVRQGVPCYDTAPLTLEEMVGLMREGVAAGKVVARLHSGDPALYGAVQEQFDALDAEGIPYEVVPGVSSFLAAAALLRRELTVPGGTQTVILTRRAGRTPVPEAESLRELARHGSTLCLFLSAGLLKEAAADLLTHLPPTTPAAVVERVSWPNERVLLTDLGDLPAAAEAAGISKTALVFVGDFLTARGRRSLLYHPRFAHGHRRGGDG